MQWRTNSLEDPDCEDLEEGAEEAELVKVSDGPEDGSKPIYLQQTTQPTGSPDGCRRIGS